MFTFIEFFWGFDLKCIKLLLRWIDILQTIISRLLGIFIIINYQLCQYHKIKIALFVKEEQLRISVLLIYIIKMAINELPEDYIDFVDNTTKQNTE